MTKDDFIRCAVGLRCTVLSKENQFLFLGTVAEFDEENDTIRLEDYQGEEMPRMGVYQGMGLKVAARLTSGRGEVILIEGKVLYSMRQYLIVQPVVAVLKEEARGNFRQNVLKSAQIAEVNRQKVKHDCVVVDISATGIAVRGRNEYQVGDLLRLSDQKFRREGPDHTVECRIVRMQKQNDGIFFYGCQFENLTGEEERKLYQDMFAIQAEELRQRHER